MMSKTEQASWAQWKKQYIDENLKEDESIELEIKQQVNITEKNSSNLPKYQMEPDADPEISNDISPNPSSYGDINIALMRSGDGIKLED